MARIPVFNEDYVREIQEELARDDFFCRPDMTAAAGS
jgi:hypothetical protein